MIVTKEQLTNYTLEKTTKGIKFYVHQDDDSIILTDLNDEFIQRIEAHSTMNYGILDLKEDI